ncbi:hypothetical protein CAEBREN_10210 [Caenorhabditis brenneri]|uniref:Uncharacterized protein n=1 Tax=Caenorhabditis brenneri TaxID=135651 RepID=G0NZ83_CAEBE|nr:hypothetical protein CAEBREN_10210 [Caenorhabditis brenneri]
MPMSDSVRTPAQEGPAADPALLANAGCTAEANEAGINMAVNAMQKFGRELEQLPAEGRKLVEQAMSSISTANHRSTGASSRTSRSSTRGGTEQDSFVRIVNTLTDLGYGALDGFRLLIITAAAQGLLTGAALAHFTVSAEPFIALSTIASSFVIAMINPMTRSSSLTTTIATSFLIHSVLGAIEGALTPIYFILMGLYTLAAMIPIQLASRDQNRANVNLYSAVLVGVTIASKCFVYGMLGVHGVPLPIERIGTEGDIEQEVNA